MKEVGGIDWNKKIEEQETSALVTAQLDLADIRQRSNNAAGQGRLLFEPLQRVCFDDVAAG